MTVVICTIFYIYVIIAVNYYRKEIVKRANDGCGYSVGGEYFCLSHGRKRRYHSDQYTAGAVFCQSFVAL